MINDLNLCDIYRELHPNTRRYTRRCKNPVKQSRLDFFLASSNILDIVKSCHVKLSYRSDHSMVELELILNHFISWKGIWKFNNSLLFIPTYVELVNKIINEEKLKYAVPVYNPNQIINTSDKIEMTIEDDEEIRNNKLKSIMVRSKLQWLHDGEKPSNFFCNLENKNFIEKTIKRYN